MRRLKLLVFSLLLIMCSIVNTGCDVQQVLDVVTRVAQGIQQAAPAIQQAVTAIQQIVEPGSASPANNNRPAETNAQTNPANVTIPNASDREEVNPATNVTTAPNTTPNNTAVGSLPDLRRPHGRADIERVFGPRGQRQVTVQMAAGPNGAMRSVTCHELIAPRLQAVFEEIRRAGLSHHIKTFDGCFVNRNKRGSNNPSTHAWGIAVDLNASENPMGQSRMTAGQRQLAAIFLRYGFHQLPNDPMHFQYCTGY